MTTHSFHTLVALHLPRTHADTVVYAGHILQQMESNPSFAAPPVTLATVRQHLQAYETAAEKAKGHAKGDAPAAAIAFKQVVDDLHLLKGYVQQIADQAGDPLKAAHVIASSGMGTHPHGVRTKPTLAAQMGAGGLVALHARAVGRHAAYEWQMSSDGGKTWTNLPSTAEAHTSLGGLTFGATYAFRYRGNLPGGQTGDWCDPVVLVIH